MERYDFTSDNTAGICPEVLEALSACNSGFEAAYGIDRISRKAADLLRSFLDADADVHFVTSGTAANAIALSSLCKPYEAVIAHRQAHIITDETGAPGFFGNGLGIIGLSGASGKMNLEELAAILEKPDNPHTQMPTVLSITNPTEYGTIYSVDELRQLTEKAREKGLTIHLDGARLANAVAAGFDPKAIKSLGVDIAVIGGTKSGMPCSEAVIIFNPKIAQRYRSRLKQSGQLPSKARFLTAPWVGMLEGEAWIHHARHANAMATRLSKIMPFNILHPVQTNAVFVEMNDSCHKRLSRMGWVIYRFMDTTVRFMCSWATTEDTVDEIGAALKSLT